MPLDANGVWQYEETDAEATASGLLNLGMASVSAVVGGLADDVTVLEGKPSQPRQGAYINYAPSATGSLATSSTAQTVVGWVDFGVAPFARTISLIGAFHIDVTTGASNGAALMSVVRLANGTVVGATIDASTGTLMQMRLPCTVSSVSQYQPMTYTEVIPAGGTNTRYVFAAYRIGAAVNFANGVGQAINATWTEVDATNRWTEFGGESY